MTVWKIGTVDDWVNFNGELVEGDSIEIIADIDFEGVEFKPLSFRTVDTNGDSASFNVDVEGVEVQGEDGLNRNVRVSNINIGIDTNLGYTGFIQNIGRRVNVVTGVDFVDFNVKKGEGPFKDVSKFLGCKIKGVIDTPEEDFNVTTVNVQGEVDIKVFSDGFRFNTNTGSRNSYVLYVRANGAVDDNGGGKRYIGIGEGREDYYNLDIVINSINLQDGYLVGGGTVGEVVGKVKVLNVSGYARNPILYAGVGSLLDLEIEIEKFSDEVVEIEMGRNSVGNIKMDIGGVREQDNCVLRGTNCFLNNTLLNAVNVFTSGEVDTGSSVKEINNNTYFSRDFYKNVAGWNI